VQTQGNRWPCMSFPLVLAVAIGVAPACLAQSQPGQAPPPLSLEATTNLPDGAEVSWDAFEGKTVVLEFWGTWCAPCVQIIPHMNELADHFSDRDDVVFLSVTYEPVGVVERFLERRVMLSWIGHDTDKSVVSAMEVRAWPTAFVIRDGTIVARAHPSRLTADNIEAFASGERPSLSERDGTLFNRASNVAITPGRSDRIRSVTPGLDPYTALPDEQPVFQVLVRDPQPGNTSMYALSGSTKATFVNATIEQIIEAMWDRERWEVQVAPELENVHHDAVINAPEHAADAVRDALLAGMSLRVETEQREITAYKATTPPAGHRMELADPYTREPLMPTPAGDEKIRFTSEASSVGALLNFVGQMMGAARIVNETGIEERVVIDVTIPRNDPDAIRRTLRETTGILLEPFTEEVDVLVVRPAD